MLFPRFAVLQFGSAFFIPAFSDTAFFTIPRFPDWRFQSPPQFRRSCRPLGTAGEKDGNKEKEEKVGGSGMRESKGEREGKTRDGKAEHPQKFPEVGAYARDYELLN